MTSLIAMLIAVPVGIGSAIFLTELCPQVLRRPIGVAIELLAGFHYHLRPLGTFYSGALRATIFQPGLISLFGNVPVLSTLFAGPPYGIGILTAGFVLAIMVLPFITSISRDVRDGAARLERGGLRPWLHHWEVSRNVVAPSRASA